MALLKSAENKKPLSDLSPWGRGYLALWGAWCTFATIMAIVGGKALRPWWWGLIATFGILEAWGSLVREDRKPMLTEVFGRYVPGWVLFPVLAVAIWRLERIGVPGWILYAGGGWQIWHFITTYHDYQKMGGK